MRVSVGTGGESADDDYIDIVGFELFDEGEDVVFAVGIAGACAYDAESARRIKIDLAERV